MFENLGKKVSGFAQVAAKKSGELAQTAAKKSGEMIEITKLNMSISNEEEIIKKRYTEIGKQYVESLDSGEDFSASVHEMCNEIKQSKENISHIKEKINQIKKDEN